MPKGDPGGYEEPNEEEWSDEQLTGLTTEELKHLDTMSESEGDAWLDRKQSGQLEADRKNEAARDAARKRMGGGDRPQDKGQASQRGRDYRSDALIPIKRHINRALDATEMFGEEDKLDTERKGPEIKRLKDKETDKGKHQKKVDAVEDEKAGRMREAEKRIAKNKERYSRRHGVRGPGGVSKGRDEPKDPGSKRYSGPGVEDPGSERYSGPGVEDTSDHAREMPGVRPEDTAKDPWWADYQASTKSKAKKAGDRERDRLTRKPKK
tara:strand:+ start:3439 stop:4236 length:798 start_codon:yes stop_codon:yes gene_type:complete